ncbi:MFS transporter [Streptomyces thermoviolaceus]|uniref:MFS transporter n=1 Tax=Streptomyces thermoviolaceus subsp. thermoviolaceus TaxID=66860 RepID=A0ABX0YWY2_STRTL|nr:MFS transporter [Streptomyces thermoviolaceus]MCM3265605.1 MFS transporter [Streptomyces thermoviolaceus]NJP16537.1 MFS transporter [Streptomyces thermoviolaceus subsp. thermoviolaceus]
MTIDRPPTEAADADAPPRLTPAQRRAFWGSFSGWAMDGFNWTVFGLVLAPTMTELLPRAGIAATADNIGWYGQISAALFLLGWGCSAVWGPLADRFGRKPTMMASILMYGVFTALAGVATDLWQWNAFRFLAAIGVGGEWAMAGTLLSEVMPERVRERFGGLMHSAAYVGVLAVSIIYLAFGPELGWRGLFLIGGLPALAVFVLRRSTPEPDRWKDTAQLAAQRSFWQPVVEILTPPYRGRTLGNLLLLVVCVIGLWAGSTYVPTAMTELAERAGESHDATVRLAGLSSMTVALFTILGCFAVPRLAARLGRRGALALLYGFMIVGTVGAYGVAYPLSSIGLTFVFLPLLGFGGATFAVFTIWLPEQYPTRMRATAFAFTTTFSRWVAAAGTFLIGYGIHAAGSLTLPLTLTTVVFVVGIGLVRLAPETRGQALPD